MKRTETKSKKRRRFEPCKRHGLDPEPVPTQERESVKTQDGIQEARCRAVQCSAVGGLIPRCYREEQKILKMGRNETREAKKMRAKRTKIDLIQDLSQNTKPRKYECTQNTLDTILRISKKSKLFDIIEKNRHDTQQLLQLQSKYRNVWTYRKQIDTLSYKINSASKKNRKNSIYRKIDTTFNANNSHSRNIENIFDVLTLSIRYRVLKLSVRYRVLKVSIRYRVLKLSIRYRVLQVSIRYRVLKLSIRYRVIEQQVIVQQRPHLDGLPVVSRFRQLVGLGVQTLRVAQTTASEHQDLRVIGTERPRCLHVRIPKTHLEKTIQMQNVYIHILYNIFIRAERIYKRNILIYRCRTYICTCLPFDFFVFCPPMHSGKYCKIAKLLKSNPTMLGSLRD